MYSRKKEPDQTLWQRMKNDEKGWFLAGPLFFIFGLAFLWLVKKFLIG